MLLFILSFFISCTEKKNLNEIKPEAIQPEEKIDFNELLFVEIINSNPGLSLYNIEKKEYKIFWYNVKEKVVELSYSKDWKYAFFITARKFGQTGSMPFINNVKLYIINIKSKKINFIEEIGSGLQVFTKWEDNSTISITLNSVDQTVANFINRNERRYNVFGKKLKDETKTFDIVNEGYPQPPAAQRNFISPDGVHSLVKSESDSAIYLRTGDGDKIFITKTGNLLNHIEWAGNVVVFSIIDKNNIGDTELFIFSLPEKKLLNQWADKSYKDFFVLNNFLFFNSKPDNKNCITVYDIEQGKEYDRIEAKNGCGLRRI